MVNYRVGSVMRGRIAGLLLPVIMLSLYSGCGPDTPTVVSSCPPESDAREIEVWRDRAILVPRASKELLSPAIWQGIAPTMSRIEVEALLAVHLRSRELYWSEFDTSLGRLRWS